MPLKPPPTTYPVTVPAPAHDGVVYLNPSIALADPGTTPTAEWDDLEAGYWVEVRSFYSTAKPDQGGIDIRIINPLGYDPKTGEPQQVGAIHGYRGGIYETRSAIGPLTLSAVTGSVPAHDLSIAFAYAGGSGTLDPFDGNFVLVPSAG